MKITLLKSLTLAFIVSMIPALQAMEEQPLDIFQAARQGNVQQLKKLLAADVSPNSRNLGNSPLSYAIREIKDDALLNEVIKCLLDAGADVDTWSLDAYTPLMIASKNNRLPAVLALLKGGAMPNLRDPDTRSALMYAAWVGAHEICQALIEHNAAVCAIDKDGLNPFDYALKHANPTECINTMICSSFFTNDYDSDERKEAIDQVMETMLCLKQLGISKDIRRMIVGKMKDKMEAILTQNILRGKNIPLFAQPAMIDALYESTRDHLKGTIQETAQRKPEIELLNMDEFETNFGDQLRMRIQSRIEKPALQIPAKKGFLNSTAWKLLKRVTTPKPSLKKLVCSFLFYCVTRSALLLKADSRAGGYLSTKTFLYGIVFMVAGISMFYTELVSGKPFGELLDLLGDISSLSSEYKKPSERFQ